MDIAKRIFEPMNDKRFQWQLQEDGSFQLSGLENSDLKATYHDVPSEDGKIRKGFRVTSAAGKKVHQDTTLDVGIFLRPLRAAITEIVTPADKTGNGNSKSKAGAKKEAVGA